MWLTFFSFSVASSNVNFDLIGFLLLILFIPISKQDIESFRHTHTTCNISSWSLKFNELGELFKRVKVASADVFFWSSCTLNIDKFRSFFDALMMKLSSSYSNDFIVKMFDEWPVHVWVRVASSILKILIDFAATAILLPSSKQIEVGRSGPQSIELSCLQFLIFHFITFPSRPAV